MRIELDEARCAGHGMCFTTAPEVYDLNDMGHVVVKVSETADAGLSSSARAGAAACSERALSVRE